MTFQDKKLITCFSNYQVMHIAGLYAYWLVHAVHLEKTNIILTFYNVIFLFEACFSSYMYTYRLIWMLYTE